MDFFLEIHNGECGLGEHFCDHVRCHGPSECQVVSHQETVSTQNPESRTQDEEMNKIVHSPNYTNS